MNIRMKSLLAGIVIAAFTFLAAKGFLNPKKQSEFGLLNPKPQAAYRVEYILKTEPADKFQLIGRLLEKRFQAGGYEYTITDSNDQSLAITVRNVTDTAYLKDIIIYTNRVQFREMYTLEEPAVQKMLLTADTLTKEMFPPINKPKDSVIKVDERISKEVRDLLVKMDSAEQKDKNPDTGFFSLVEIISPYTETSGKIHYPATIGMVWSKDTAMVRKILLSPKVLQKGPGDLLFYFGPGPANPNNSIQDKQYLYAISSYGRLEKALLENEDIKDASLNFDLNGRPEVVLEFNKAGSIKWKNLTERSIGHPIAIIVNNSVVTAPNVLEAITDGRAIINGSFSASDGEKISMQLKSGPFPAVLSMVSSKITTEKATSHLNHVWITLIAFILASTLTFFILKTLKPI